MGAFTHNNKGIKFNVVATKYLTKLVENQALKSFVK
jgi:hypothetical protein